MMSTRQAKKRAVNLFVDVELLDEAMNRAWESRARLAEMGRELHLGNGFADARPRFLRGDLPGGSEPFGVFRRYGRRGRAVLFDHMLGNAPDILIVNHLWALLEEGDARTGERSRQGEATLYGALWSVTERKLPRCR